ncbi:hypothetical protein FKM82_001435 [Ascaphus truei]
MLCWGHSAFGQLGIGPGFPVVPEPCTCSFSLAKCIKYVACGGNHSVFLLEDSQVYSCGWNGDGQLGHGREGIRPDQVSALADEHIIQVACGQSHNLALNNQGQLFSWGAGSDGQLGHSTTEDSIPVPRLIKKLTQQKILQVSCGNWHCMALADDGQLFTWGQNDHGQLGLGKGFVSQSSPQRVKSLEGIPLAQVTGGGSHSFALSLSGAVFGWGKNSAGQLGLNDEQARESPCHVKPLRTQKVVYISCGEEHTAILTKTGGVFTFGAGACGQLGHDSLHDEINPRRVLELMGSEVSQIACGSNPAAYNIIKHIFSGGNQTFVLCSQFENSQPADDFRSCTHGNYTSRINDETIDVWRQKVLDNSGSNTINGVVQTLSSSACWNGSFLDKRNDEHFKTSPKIPGISLCSIRTLFEKLMNAHHSRLLEQILKGFESFLIPQLSSSPPDVEAMRIYLILPEFPLLQDSKYYITLTLPLAMAILRLDANPSKVLDNWWSRICPNYFFKLIDLYKGAVVYLLNGRKTLLIPVLFASYITAALRLLEKMHKVNMKVQHVENDTFYIPEISSLVDIQEDYLMWFLNQAGLKVRPSIMQTDAELQMQVAINGANLQNVFMLLTLEPMLAKNPFLVLHVRRSSLVADSLRELSIYSDIDLKKPLKVIFDGEEAVDDGGVTKEFFLLLLKELLNPIYGMFTFYQDSNLIWFSDICNHPFQHCHQVRMATIFCFHNFSLRSYNCIICGICWTFWR